MKTLKTDESLVIMTLDDYDDMTNHTKSIEREYDQMKRLHDELIVLGKEQSAMIDKLSEKINLYERFIDRLAIGNLWSEFNEKGDLKF